MTHSVTQEACPDRPGDVHVVARRGPCNLQRCHRSHPAECNGAQSLSLMPPSSVGQDWQLGLLLVPVVGQQ
jgi:hypothetical protein